MTFNKRPPPPLFPDSYVVAISGPTLLAVEDDALPPSLRTKLRRKLFGESLASLAYSTKPAGVPVWGSRFLSKTKTKSGTLKVEKGGFRKSVFVGLKVYCLSDSDSSDDTSKFKALATRTTLRPDTYDRLTADAGADLYQRRTSLRATGGIHVTETTSRVTSLRSRLQFKFQTVAPNDTRAFE